MDINVTKTAEFFSTQNRQNTGKAQSRQKQENAGKPVPGSKRQTVGKTKDRQGPIAVGNRRFIITDSSDIGAMLSSGRMEVDGVSIELSEEAKLALEEAREKLIAERTAELERYTAEFNGYVAKQQSEAYEDMAEDMAKALETARRIANGDIVPAKDEQKLLEYDAELYKMAKNAAMLHEMEERRKQKSLYENEEEREYTDPEEETTPMQEFGVAVELSAVDAPVVGDVVEIEPGTVG
ncbi:MAG: hypothetical protein K2P30_00620 [Lachnospiraceae bacterium]|nr:hypothetical protein [Lachnospiraceae bacterium]